MQLVNSAQHRREKTRQRQGCLTQLPDVVILVTTGEFTLCCPLYAVPLACLPRSAHGAGGILHQACRQEVEGEDVTTKSLEVPAEVAAV